MKYALALVAVAGIAANAFAANTHFVMEVSGDNGATWGPSVTVPSGTVVKARLIAQFVGPETVTGLAGFNMTFRVAGWNGTQDTLGAWDAPQAGGITGIAGGVAAGGNGRQFPFAAGSTAVLPVVVAGDPLQINGGTAGRIPVSQGPQSNAGALFNGSLSPVVFIFSFTALNTLGAGDRNLGVNVNSIFNTTADNAKWYTSTGSTSINAPIAAGDSASRTASVTVTPTPGALALLGLGGLVAGRRRR